VEFVSLGEWSHVCYWVKTKVNRLTDLLLSVRLQVDCCQPLVHSCPEDCRPRNIRRIASKKYLTYSDGSARGRTWNEQVNVWHKHSRIKLSKYWARYILVRPIHSISHKSGRFCCIMYRIGKTTLLLIVTTWQFWRYQKLALIAFKTTQTP